MKPYLPDHKQGMPKFKAERTDHVPGTAKGMSKQAKLIAKNANRAGKKALRQYDKLMTRRVVEDLPNEPIYAVEDILKQSEEDDLSTWREKGIL